MAKVIKGLTPSLQWLSDMLSFFQAEPIKIPREYRARVLEVKKMLNNDPSGLVGTMLDFAISSALVDYKVETKNKNLNTILNKWLVDVNKEQRGKIPTGIEALAKEYFRERWKGSSNLLLRTFWEKTPDGLTLPTTLFFVDGEDIKVKRGDPNVVRLGEEDYAIRVSAHEQDDINLPTSKDEMIFVQRPFESWGTLVPNPFLVKRGLYKNLKFFDLLSSKGEFVVSRALEYMFVIKKGTERLALDGRPEFTYSEDDLKGIKDDLRKILMAKKNEAGTPTYTTNFDTDLEHLIPEYSKAINDTIYSPIEKRLLAGIGLINIVEGVGSTRKESTLNPKPFMEEIRQGVKDFKCLLNDLILTIVDKNLRSHPKWMNQEIKIYNTPIKAFMTDKFMQVLRSMYDRGRLSSRTFVEVVGGLDYDLELKRVRDEKTNKEDITLYPPVTQNQEQNDDESENTPDNKKGVEKLNFTLSSDDLDMDQELRCSECNFEGALNKFVIKINKKKSDIHVTCPECNEPLPVADLVNARIIGEPVDPRRTDKSKKKKKKSIYGKKEK